ncbi:putative hydrolase YxeP (plasmid) [Variovorax sp. SRS16]|uniref:amidohydrolase n=1 Tax=Variovorax sp. SRS16 TaxID=282217 RepID=UPI001318196C|nr:amidohydrolase [Variovorax sp. SRS16]VTU46467.1 putative hydrolase YxeP [Variovorax sp. SRS16]
MTTLSAEPSILALEEVASWRHDLHANPELLYDCHRTSGKVMDLLRGFGCDEVVGGIGGTGVVAVVRGQEDGPTTIGLRADMDALPIEETGRLPYRSVCAGRMHACGHDGHTSMLLGAAKALCATRRFAGSAVLIFQPAEEGGAGAQAMVDDGLMERFGIQQVYAMHNCPGMPVGHFGLRAGPMMGAVDYPTIDIEGAGVHAASPHLGVDPVLIGAHIITAAQGIVARNVDPLACAAVSITTFETGTARSVIPAKVRLSGTVRTLSEQVRTRVEQRLRELVAGIAQAHGGKATLSYQRSQPVLVNDRLASAVAAAVAKRIVGDACVDTEFTPVLAGEDFAFMLNVRPGALIWIGNGDSAPLHHPAYDFNDRALSYGVSFWTRLVETQMPITASTSDSSATVTSRPLLQPTS